MNVSKKLLLLLLLTAPLLVCYGQEKTWNAKKELSNHDWNRDGIDRYENFEDNLMTFKTNRMGSNRFLHPVFIDYSKDFKISVYVKEATHYGYSFLFNASAGGAYGMHVEITEKSINIYNSMIAGNVGLYGKKNKRLNLYEPHYLIVGMENGEHYIAVEQYEKTKELFRGRLSVSNRRFNLGFMMNRQNDVDRYVNVLNVEATYHESTEIDFIVNPRECFGHKEKLRSDISGNEHELAAIVSTDGKKLYFVRKPATYESDERMIWEADIENGIISAPKESAINYLTNNYLINMSPDNNRAFISGVFDDFKQIKSGISSRARKSDGSWTSPTEILLPGFETDNKEISNFITSDGQIIIASLEKEGGQGAEDLYVTVKGTNGEFGDLINLGPSINTENPEITPFLGADNQTLYFALETNKQGFGSSDIYVAKRLDSTWQKWSKPINMGYRINTADWEAYMSVPASGEYIYFISTNDRSGQDADIYRIKLHSREVKPEPVTLLNGRVLDIKDSSALGGKVIYKNLSTNQVVGEAFADPETGAFQLVLPYKANYSIYAQAEGYYPKRDTINMRHLGFYKIRGKDLYLQKMEVGTAIRLNNIFFETGEAKLLSGSFDELNELATILRTNRTIELDINGYTDNVGNKNANLVLSKDRAQSVMVYLKNKGIAPERMKFKGFGEANPLNDNSTDEKRQANRRVEFVITKQ